LVYEIRGRAARDKYSRRPSRFVAFWHFASFAAPQYFGSYWRHSGHWPTLALIASVAIDPTATLQSRIGSHIYQPVGRHWVCLAWKYCGATPIDAAAPSCFDTRKVRPIKRRWLNGGCYVRGGKYYFSGVKREALSNFDRKSPNSQSKKSNGVDRKTVRRLKISKSEDWYEKAALSMAIRR
jgi:hypothetical protein